MNMLKCLFDFLMKWLWKKTLSSYLHTGYLVVLSRAEGSEIDISKLWWGVWIPRGRGHTIARSIWEIHSGMQHHSLLDTERFPLSNIFRSIGVSLWGIMLWSCVDCWWGGGSSVGAFTTMECETPSLRIMSNQFLPTSIKQLLLKPIIATEYGVSSEVRVNPGL